MKPLTLVTTAALALTVLSACGKKETKTIETPQGTVEATKDKATFTAKDGTTATMGEDNVELPADFPKDIPTPDGAHIFMVASSPKGHTISMKTSDSPEKIVAFFREKMIANGWKEVRAVDTPNGGMFTFSEGDRSANVTVAGGPDGTTVNLKAE